MESRPDLDPLMPSDASVETRQSWPLQSSTKKDDVAGKRLNWISRLAEPLRINDGIRHGWKPLSMTTPILVAIAAISIVMAVSVELLAQASKAQGGLALSPSQDDIPQYAMLSYLYGPNIVAVVYSLIWSWVDLDVKRMQPWFELSKPSGATAENSMFLEYPYDFVAFVPFKAAKRRHWPVFLSGTVMVIVFWVITPLQTSILGTGVVNRTEPVVIGTRSKLAPLSAQKALLSNEILNTGYSIGWLGQPFPPFMAADYATLPFYVDNDPTHARPQTNWTATTTKLTTELDCWPATFSRNGPTRTDFSFLNGQGCNASSIIINPSNNFTMLYVGYYSDAHSDFNLGGTNCPRTANSTHQFLAIWARRVRVPNQQLPEVDITALFCQPYYYKQEVSVSVAAESLIPYDVSVTPVSPREPLSDKEFNSTAFEYLIVNGIAQETTKRDFPFNQVIEKHPLLDRTNLTKPVSNMVGYALAGHNEPAGRYADPKVLREAFNHAHQYLFSVAVNRLLVNETNFSNHTATSTYPLSGILVSRLFSALVEAFLLVVAISTIILLWLCQTSPNNLLANPSSISRLVEIFRHGPDLNHVFRSVDNADADSLLELFRNDKFRLSRNHGLEDEGVFIERITEETLVQAERKLDSQMGYYEPIRPTFLRREMGFLFGLFQMGAIIGLTYLKWQDDKQKGLIRPTQNFEILQLLENYLPTIFATLTEPFWIALNRFLCLLQPFNVLSKGRSKPSESIDTTYTSLPPQLVIWRAIKSRHFLLTMICIIALLSNVLAVGLGALFNENQTIATYTEEFSPTIAPRFDNQSVVGFQSYLGTRLLTSVMYQDPMYITMANISSGTPLPPWTSTKYFFQPYITNKRESDNSTNSYVVNTRGFGVSANCTSVPRSIVPVNMSTSLGDTCGDLAEIGKMRMRTSTFTRPEGPSAIEYGERVNPESTLDNSCGTALTVGWGRTPSGRDMNATVEASFAICRPVFQTAMFNVRYDPLGYVLSYERTSDISSDLDYADSKFHTAAMVTHQNSLFGMFGLRWHNDTLSQDWMGHLLLISTKSRDALDPNKPVPNPEDLIPTIEDIYQRVFVLLLSLNQHLFEPGDRNAVVVGQKLVGETRIFMDKPAFIITMTVLGLNVVMAIIFYSRAIVFNLPRMPTTIGSILAFVASSRLLRKDEAESLKEERTISFGRFIGTDQKVHLGIEKDPYVVLIDPASLREEKPLISSLFSRLRKRRKTVPSVRSGTWL